MSVNEKMTALANEIRKYGKLDSSLSIDGMTRAIAPLHELAFSDGEMSGRDIGYDEGKIDGIEQGKQAELSEFWDMLQMNGTRTNYQMAFFRFDEEFFTPKYDFEPIQAQQMFMEAQIVNFKQILENANVKFDTSKAKYVTQMFANSTITHIPIIDTTSASTVQSVFASGSIVSIEKLIVKEEQTFSSCFAGASKLVEIRLEGVIANDYDIHWSPLSKSSIESIVSHLADNVSGKTASFKKTAVLTAFGTEEAWLEYIALKPNWTFTLI